MPGGAGSRPHIPPMATVTVVLPAFNAEPTLGAALESLRRQSLPDWECLLIDDGSSDGTWDVAESAARRDPRVTPVRRPRQGLVATLAEAIGMASTRYIARMDADDLMRRDRLARQVAALDADPGLALVGCHVRGFPRPALSPRRREYESWLNSLATESAIRRDALVECPLAHPTWMARASLFHSVPYRDMAWAEDYDLLLRALAAGHRIGVVPARLHAWRDGPGRLSRADPRYGPARFTACKADHLARGFLAASPRYILWGYGDTGRVLRRALLAHGKEPAAIVEVKAGRIGQSIHGAPVVAIDDLRRLPRLPVVVSVARAGPRGEVRAALAAMGFVEERDFVCAA